MFWYLKFETSVSTGTKSYTGRFGFQLNYGITKSASCCRRLKPRKNCSTQMPKISKDTDKQRKLVHKRLMLWITQTRFWVNQLWYNLHKPPVHELTSNFWRTQEEKFLNLKYIVYEHISTRCNEFGTWYSSCKSDHL